MDAKTYFRHHKRDVARAVKSSLVRVRPVKEGESLIIDEGTRFSWTMAYNNGWWLDAYQDFKILTSVEGFNKFCQKYKRVSVGSVGLEEIPLPKGATVEPVSKGEKIVINSKVSNTCLETAIGEDGYLVISQGETHFFSDLDFKATFNKSAEIQDNMKGFYREISPKSFRKVPFLVVKEDVTLDLNGVPCEISAGSVLYREKGKYTYTDYNDFKKRFVVLDQSPPFSLTHNRFTQGLKKVFKI